MGAVSVAVAIVVGLVSSFIQSFGLTVQRKSHVQEELLPPSSRRKPVRRPLWLLGFTIYITSNVFSTIFQLDALPIVILAPLGAVSLIFNALLARIILGDAFGRQSAVGTGLVALGAVLIAVFGVVEEKEHSLDDLLELWGRPAFLIFFSVVGVVTLLVLVASHVASWHVSRGRRGRIALTGEDTPPLSSRPPSNYASPQEPPPIPFRPTSRRWSAPTSPYRPSTETLHDRKHIVRFERSRSPRPKSPCSVGVTASSPEPDISDADLAHQRSLTLIGLSFAAASGTLSGMSLVLAKAAVELLVITIDHVRTGQGENQFVRAQSWLLVAGLAVGAILQLIYLNYSLTFASPALICPLAFCFFNLSSIFDGLVFYDQFGRLAPHQISLVSVGVVILLLGVWVVSALQPTGQGGVEVGTWAEEDTLSVNDLDAQVVLETGEHTALLSGSVAQPPSADLRYAQPASPALPDFPISSPPLSPTSPTSPPSPASRARLRQPHRGPRYGTFIPDLGPPGAPTGFSIGLGAASPGFVLRSGSISLPPAGGQYRRGRSVSADPQSIQAILYGEGYGVPRETTERRSAVGDGEVGRAGEDAAEEVSGWDRGHFRRKSWLPDWFRRVSGRIKLPDEDEPGGAR